MRPLPFTFRQLQVFASLSETRSFRHTAESLGISQASVSSQMKTLEDQLGLALLARGRGQQTRLTAEGLAFLDDLRTFEAAGETLAAHRRRVVRDGMLPARFRLLVGQGTLDKFIRPKLDRFFAVHPHIELTFEWHIPSSELARDIAEDRYDFVLVHRLMDAPCEPKLRHLATMRGGVYGHVDLVKGKALPLTAREINELPFILPINYPPEPIMLEFYRQHGIRPRYVTGRTQHYDVMVAMVERGVGVACLTDAILSPEKREEVVMLRQLENWRLMWYRKDTSRDPRCDAVESFLMSSVLQDPNYRTISVTADAAA